MLSFLNKEDSTVALTLCVLLNLFRQNALLATISEKDANIALLELSPTVGSDDEVRKFKAEKDKLVNELKEQVTEAGTSQNQNELKD